MQTIWQFYDAHLNQLPYNTDNREEVINLIDKLYGIHNALMPVSIAGEEYEEIVSVARYYEDSDNYPVLGFIKEI